MRRGEQAGVDTAAADALSRLRRSALLLPVVVMTLTGCGVESPPVYVDDRVDTPGPRAESSAATSTAATSAPDPPVEPAPTSTVLPSTAPAPIVVERAYSPENAIAEISGLGATTSDPVTVDGQPADVESFVVAVDGSFVVRVRILAEGPHTVCVRDACSRVLTRALDAATDEEIVAEVNEARRRAAEIFDGESEFPGWSIVQAGPLSGTGGSTDLEARTITVHANRDRSVEEFVVTILHEWGHVVDHERMNDDDRAEYRRRRGYAPDVAWRSEARHSVDEWSVQPSEDFAEVVVAFWTSTTANPHTVRTAAPAGQPDADTLAFVGGLVPGSR